MQRYFVPFDNIAEHTVTIDRDDANHMVKVMRMKIGDSFLCVNPAGQVALCQVENIANENVQATIVQWIDENNEMPVSVTIAQGLPKGDKLELVVQKGTELGASTFLPFFASRSIVKWDEKKGRKKVERLEKIAKEAAEQCHRNKIPTIHVPVNLSQLIEMANEYDHKIVAYEEEAKANKQSLLANALQQVRKSDTILAVFGPEGGFTEAEISKLKANGFQTCALGPRILRTETAPLYFLAAVSYQIELLR